MFQSPQPESADLGSRRSRAKRRRSPSPVELRGSSKRKKTATTRRIPPRVPDDTGGGGGGGGAVKVEEDITKDMPNPAPVPRVEEVPPQAISREGEDVM